MEDEIHFSEHRKQTEMKGSGSKPPPNFFGRLKSPEVKFVCCYCCKSLALPDPIYPHLNASVCRDCSRLKPARRIEENNVSNKHLAPWSEEEVDSLNKYQLSDLLPYICHRGHVLKADQSGFKCRFCARYSLTWAYDWTLQCRWL